MILNDLNLVSWFVMLSSFSAQLRFALFLAISMPGNEQ
jgi:hypothetical protein